MSKIEWTNVTWNPVTGCTKVSAGCDNCYAERLANRGILRENYLARLPVFKSDRHDPFAIRLWPERLDRPARWRKPRRIFVNSMSDLFHASIPLGFLGAIFRVMLDESRHTFQILTKRPASAARLLSELDPVGQILPSHIWIGTSIEDHRVKYRIRHLRTIKATVRFLSVEPLIGPMGQLNLDGIHWVIVGGESGPRARPMDPQWAREVRDQCIEAKVPFFFKQWGGLRVRSKSRALDGKIWNEMPGHASRSLFE